MIVEGFLTKNQYSRPGKPIGKIRGVVIHYIGVNDQRPEQTVNYFESLKKGTNGIYASAHYVIGKDGNGIQCIPDNEIAYHCGAKEYKPGISRKLGTYPNASTIGIELCHSINGFTEETLETAAKLTVMILSVNNLTENDVYRHYDITGKNCPKFFVEDEKQWEDFKNRIRSMMC